MYSDWTVKTHNQSDKKYSIAEILLPFLWSQPVPGWEQAWRSVDDFMNVSKFMDQDCLMNGALVFGSGAVYGSGV